MSDWFSYQVFIFGARYFPSSDGMILTMKILVKNRQKSLAEKNSSQILWKSFFPEK
jgi:hypothetical protein